MADLNWLADRSAASHAFSAATIGDPGLRCATGVVDRREEVLACRTPILPLPRPGTGQLSTRPAATAPLTTSCR